MHRLPTFTRILSALINKYLFVDITDKIIVNTVVDSVDNLNRAYSMLSTSLTLSLNQEGLVERGRSLVPKVKLIKPA